MAGRLVGFAGFVAWLGALSPAVALAQTPPRVALTWTAPAQCPGGSAIVAEVDRILGEQGARPAAPLAVDARVTGSEGAYVVEVRTTSADGPRSRSLRGKTCAAVADATALVIALAIDPNAIPPPRPEPVAAPALSPSSSGSPAPGPSAPTEVTPAPRAPPPTPEASADAAPPPKPAPKPTPKPAAPAPPPKPIATRVAPSYRLQAWGGGETGALPAATPMFGAEAGVVLVNFRLMLGGEGLLSQKHLLPASQVGGNVGLGAGYLDVGYTFTPGAFELGPLAGLEIGSLQASGSGTPSDATKSQLWEAVRVGGFASWFPVRRFGLVTRLEAAFPVAPRRKFIINGPTKETNETVAQPGVASGRAMLGVELRLQ